MIIFLLPILISSQTNRLLDARRRLESNGNIEIQDRVWELLYDKTTSVPFNVVVQFTLNEGRNSRERCGTQGENLCKSVGADLVDETDSIYCRTDSWKYLGPDTIDEHSSYICTRDVYGISSLDMASVDSLIDISEMPSTVAMATLEKNITPVQAETTTVQAETTTCTLQESATLSWGLGYMDQHSDSPTGLSSYPHQANDGEGSVIYILDTGTNEEHQDWEDRLIAVENFARSGVTGDSDGHGTHVMGTAGGKQYGVAKGASLYGITVFGRGGSADTNDIIDGLIRVLELVEANNEKAVINMSLGGIWNPVFNNAVAAVVDNGVSVTVAAGNAGLDACWSSPGSARGVINVGSITEQGRLASTSNVGSCVDILAPGELITSAWKNGCKAFETISGTSMASPHVAGAVAIIMQRYDTSDPEAIRNILLSETEGWSARDAVRGTRRGTPNIALQIPPLGTDCADDFVLPTSICGSCQDIEGWVDSEGDGCLIYSSCLEPGWEETLASNGQSYYDTWAVDGVSALDACCDCGGGVCNDWDAGVAARTAGTRYSDYTECSQVESYCNLEVVQELCPVTCGTVCGNN